MRTVIITLCLAIIVALSATVSATQSDSVKVFGALGIINNTHDHDQYFQYDYFRAGFRAYKGQFMTRLEYDFRNHKLCWGYVEYSFTDSALMVGPRWTKTWNFGLQVGQVALPFAGIYPAPTARPMPRYGYALDDLSVPVTGIKAYAGYGAYQFTLANYGYEKYAADLQIGPLHGWWTKDEGQGFLFQGSYHQLVNLFAGWTNYQDQPGRVSPERRNVVFIQNHFRFGERMRIYTHLDIGDFDDRSSNAEFIGGLNYRLFSGDDESTIGVFYDTIKKWQIRTTYGFYKFF